MRTAEFLKDVRVATPCRADWNSMEGDEKRRFCLSCKKHVHNFSAMTETEIMDLYRQQGSDLCIRFYVRRDGTMIVGDCPVGMRRQKRNRVVAFAVGLMATMLVGGAIAQGSANRDYTVQEILERNPITARLLQLLGWQRPPPTMPPTIMGLMVIPPLPTNLPPTGAPPLPETQDDL